MSDSPVSPPMGDGSTPHRKSWGCMRWTLVIGGSIFVLILLTAGCLAVHTSSAWKDFSAHQDAALQLAKAKTGQRVPLAGPAQSGNAWDAYGPLLARMAAAQKASKSKDTTLVSESLRENPKEEAIQRARACLVEAAEELDRLRTAAKAERALYPTDWAKGSMGDIPSLLTCQHVANLLAFSARERFAAGNSDAAMDDLAAGFQFADDVANSPMLISTMIGTAMVGIELDVLKAAIQDGRLSPAQLERAARLLAGVDAQFPAFADALEAELTLSNETMRQVGEGKLAGGGSPLPTGTGFLGRFFAVHAARRSERLLEAAREGGSKDLVSASRRYDAEIADVPSWNVLARIALPGLTAADRAMRARRAQVRVLRAAVMIRLGRSSADPDWPVDPFDLKPLRCREAEGVIRISSVGNDCVEGTTGAWRTTKPDEDIVLELKK